MSPPSDIKWLHRFAVLTAVATFALLGAGGLVTSHGVGMAVPDWPNTYGYNPFLFPPSKWVGGILYEHSHRLIAALVGLLTTALAMWMWWRETRSTVRWVGIGLMAFVIALMGVRQMPVYVTLASLAPVAIGFALYKSSRSSGWRWLAVMALAAVILQGVLGGLRVVWLKDEIGILHATLAQLFFVLMCLIALFTSPWWPRTVSGYAGERVSEQAESIHPRTHALTYPLSWLVLATTALILMQLILGATMRHQHAGLAIPDFPLAYGKLWPAMDVDSVARYNQQRLEVMDANPITAFQIGLQMAHRILAAVILICVASATWLAQRWSSDRADNTRVERQRFGVARCSWLWLGLILVQAILGAATILTRKAADVATAHVLMGALSLVTGALLSILCFRSAECAAGVSPAESASANWRMNESEPVMGVSSAGRMPATR